MPSKPKTRYAAPALEKGLDILEHLAGTSLPQTQADLMRALGRTQSEIYRMLECLVRRGYVQREANSGAYRLTLKIYALGHQQHQVSLLRRAAAIPMEELAETTGLSCHLSLPQGGDLLVVMERLPARRVCLAVGEGSVLPLSTCASGFVLLTGLPDEASRRRALEQDPEFLCMSRRRQSAFLKDLEAHDAAGTLRVPSRITPGGVDMVTSIGIAGTDAFGALALAYVEGKPNASARRRREKALRFCAETINRNLGL